MGYCIMVSRRHRQDAACITANSYRLYSTKEEAETDVLDRPQRPGIAYSVVEIYA